MRKLTKLAIFNLVFAIIAILLKITIGFDSGPAKMLFIIFEVAVFFIGNGIIFIFSEKVSYQIDKLSTIQDCIGALNQCMKANPSFEVEISKAIDQLETLERKAEALKLLLSQNSIENSFTTVLQTAKKAEFFAFSNVQNIIIRLITFDNKEYLENPSAIDIKPYKIFINEKLESNNLILKEYSDMLLALSAINETQVIDISEITEMTTALNSVLKRDEFKTIDEKYRKESSVSVQVN